MHPQQLFVLELCSNTLTGDLISTYRDTGVYLGISGSLGGSLARVGAPTVYTGTAFSMAVASGRVSFVLGLTGPCFPVDTACSASLVAMHLGTVALKLHECSRSCVCGQGLLEESLYESFSAARMLSFHGRCHVFDKRADGYCRGEAGVALSLTLKSEIVEVEGVAVQQDGSSASLTAPNGASQR